MKSFYILHKSAEEIEDMREKSIEITDFSKKISILNDLNINYSQIEINDYRFFDETDICKQNKIYDLYVDSVLEVYFPSFWDEKTKGYVYYPQKKTIEKKPFTIYVYSWDEIKITNDIQNLQFLSDDTTETSKRQVIITITNNNK